MANNQRFNQNKKIKRRRRNRNKNNNNNNDDEFFNGNGLLNGTRRRDRIPSPLIRERIFFRDDTITPEKPLELFE